MKFRKIFGLGDREEEYTGLFIDFIQEWSQFFSACNWYTFHPIYWEVEDDRIMGGVEMTMIILGVGFRVRYNYKITERAKEIKESVAKLMNGDMAGDSDGE